MDEEPATRRSIFAVWRWSWWNLALSASLTGVVLAVGWHFRATRCEVCGAAATSHVTDSGPWPFTHHYCSDHADPVKRAFAEIRKAANAL